MGPRGRGRVRPRVLDTVSRRSGGLPVDEGAFEGVRVVELAQWVFVPVAGALLADWGADVIRIERPRGRSLPRAHDAGHRRRQRRRQHVDRAREPRQAVDRARPATRGGPRGPAPAARDGRRVPHQLPARRAAAPRARRRDAHRAVPVAGVHARAWLRGAGARRGPRRGTTRRRSGPGVGWRTCSRPRRWTSRSANAAPWATGTVRWHWRSAWRLRCSSAPAPGRGRWSTSLSSASRCGRCRRTCSPRCRGRSHARWAARLRT